MPASSFHLITYLRRPVRGSNAWLSLAWVGAVLIGLFCPQPLAAQRTRVVSINSNNILGDAGSQRPSISYDGRYVAFASSAGNLDSRDTNGLRDVFVRDRMQGTTSVVSLNSMGEIGVFLSTAAAISGDGTRVAFESPAPNFVAMDTNGAIDVFVHTLATGQTRRVSLDSGGFEVSGNSFNAAISGDGRHVSFDSGSSMLVILDENNFQDVFVKDLVTEQTTMMSVRLIGDGQGGDDRSGKSDISRNGRYVVFESRATNLVANDFNRRQDIFVRDRDPDSDGIFDEGNGVTIRVSVSSAGDEANGNSSDAAISPDGEWVVFASDATNLVPGDTNQQVDVFLHSLITGETTRESISEDRLSVGVIPVEGNGFSGFPDVSNDARFVFFESLATNLVPGDTNPFADLFVRDRMLGVTTRLSIDSNCVQGNQGSRFASASEDGSEVAFESFADNLIPNDTNAQNDVFVAQAQLDTPIQIDIVEPDIGSESGGDAVRLIGQGFTTIAGTTVTFNGVPATVLEVNSNFMRVTTPPGTGIAEIVVQNSNGCEPYTGRFAYIEPFFAARFGHVNEAFGSRENVLRINSRIGNQRREVVIAPRTSIRIDIQSPSFTPNARFAVYAWLQAPTRSSVTPLPFNLGDMVLPAPFTAGVPQPVAIWNNLGRQQHLGSPTFQVGPAPAVLLDRPGGSPAPATVTVQGLIQDIGSRAMVPDPQKVSITNAVILKIR